MIAQDENCSGAEWRYAALKIAIAH